MDINTAASIVYGPGIVERTNCLDGYNPLEIRPLTRDERVDEQTKEYLGRLLGELLYDYHANPALISAIFAIVHKREKTIEEQALYDALEELARATAEHVTE